MIFETDFFQQREFTKEQLSLYLATAKRDLMIAEKNQEIEVKFLFSYNALLKLGIYSIACKGYKVKSRSGHHIKIIEALSELYENKDILSYGELMMQKRNIDLYLGGSVVM